MNRSTHRRHNSGARERTLAAAMVIALSGIGLSSQVVGAGKPLQSISMLAEDGGPYYEQITRGAESVAKAIDSAVPISLPLAVAAELPLPKAPVGSAALRRDRGPQRWTTWRCRARHW